MPNTGATGVSIIVVGLFAVAVGIVLTRFTSRKRRLPFAMILVLIAPMFATAPQRSSASVADCSPSTSLAFSWPRRPGAPAEPVCDKLLRVIEGDIEFFPNIGFVADTGSGDGRYFGFSTDPNDPDDFENPGAWLDGYTPTELSYEWQTLVDEVWAATPWNTGTNPMIVTADTPLLNTISGALFARTGRLFIRASDGTIEQGCDVYFTSFE